MAIYIYKNNQQTGPFDDNAVIEWLKKGQLSPDDMAFRQGQAGWQPLKNIFPFAGAPILPTQSSPPQVSLNNQYTSPPQKSGGGAGKTILILALVFGFILVVGIGGVVGLYFLMKGQQTTTLLANNTRTTTNSTTNTRPTNSTTNSTTNSSTTTNSSSNSTPYENETVMRDSFRSKESEFTTIPTKTQLTSSPYTKGKLAYYTYDLKVGEKSSYWLLSNVVPSKATGVDEKLKDLYAQNPDEVGTIVIRKCQQVKVGTYRIYRKTSGATEKMVPGYNENCDVTLIDREAAAVIFRKKFEGKLGEDLSATGSEDKFEAYIPYQQIADFLSSLPRK